MWRRSLDLSSDTSLAPIAELLGTVEQAGRTAGLQVFVVGALARDLWLEAGAGVPTGRRTSDADFAVACADWHVFERLVTSLRGLGLERDRRMLHRLHHPNGHQIDLLPFGGVEGDDRTLAWPPDDDPVMSMLGFADVARATAAFRLPGGVEVAVVRLHALALLKLVAWDDRRQRHRGKDAPDFAVVMRNYFDHGGSDLPRDEIEEILERHEYDDELAGAEMLGRDMATLAGASARAAVLAILERETDPEGALELARELEPYEPDRALPRLAALEHGFVAGA